MVNSAVPFCGANHDDKTFFAKPRLHDKHGEKLFSRSPLYLFKDAYDLVLAKVIRQVGHVQLGVLDVLRRRSRDANLHKEKVTRKFRLGEKVSATRATTTVVKYVKPLSLALMN